MSENKTLQEIFECVRKSRAEFRCSGLHVEARDLGLVMQSKTPEEALLCLGKFIEGKKAWLEKKYTELFVDGQKEEVINPDDIPF